jgi:hypothetical protein
MIRIPKTGGADIMTEAEWLACIDPTPMLAFLRGKASERRLRLFACACCRRVGHLLTDERSRRAVDTAARYADGIASAGELRTAISEAYEAASEALPAFAGHASDPVQAASLARYRAASSVYHASDYGVGLAAEDAAAASSVSAWPVCQKAEQPAQCLLLRCIFGNPFRHSPPLPPAVLAWNGGTVRRIAEGIYQERSFNRLPILADALLDAGCDDEALIQHCRGAGPHVRGCWAVDLILGKE